MAPKKPTASKDSTKGAAASSAPPSTTEANSSSATPKAGAPDSKPKKGSSEATAASGKKGGASHSPAAKAKQAISEAAAITTAQAEASAHAPPTVPKAPPEVTLHGVCRAYDGRRAMAALLMRKVKRELQEKAQKRLAIVESFDATRSSSVRNIEKDAQSRRERQLKAQKALCEAAFDGDIVAIRRAISSGADVNKKDEEGNFALGEAAVNGQTAAVELLVSLGADVNSKGVFGRTPIWRACFNNHTDAAKALLNLGGDPRIVAQNESAIDIARDDIKTCFAGWDMKKTDALVAKITTQQAAKQAADAEKVQTLLKSQNDVVAEAKKKLDAANKELAHAKIELERRIFEYDMVTRGGVAAGVSVQGAKEEALEAALASLRDQEKRVEALEKAQLERTHVYLDSVAKRSQVLEDNADVLKGAVGTGDNATTGLVPAIEVKFSSIGDVVLRDTERQLGTKWALLIDPSDRAPTFLRHRDVNYVDAFRPSHLSAASLRLSLLGSLRYGKPLVIDLHDVPVLESVVAAFNTIKEGLWGQILDRSVMTPDVYLPLVKDEDGDQYTSAKFVGNVGRFVLVLVTSALFVDDDTLAAVVAFRISE